MSLSSFVVKIVRKGRSINSSKLKDFSFHSEEVVPKTRLDTDPVHSRVVPYTFTTEPIEGRNAILEFEHHYEYAPGTIFMFSFDGETFYMMPFSFGLNYMTGSIERFYGYVDKNKMYVDLKRTGTTWNPLKGKTVYIKYRILDTVGMA